MSNEFFGLYRGKVVFNDDLDEDQNYLGRIKVYVPQVYGGVGKSEEELIKKLPWASPCFPFGGGHLDGDGGEAISYGSVFIPPVGSSVWVAFEQGDPTIPVWLGCWYGSVESDNSELTQSGTTVSGSRKRNWVSEIGDEVKKDERTGISYPNLLVIKSPSSATGMYIRFVGENRLELVADENNYVELDIDTKSIKVNTSDWNINLVSSEGDINLSAKNINITAKEDIKLISNENVRVTSAKSVVVTGTEEVRMQSQNQVRCSSPASSGFEHHP